MLPYSKPQQNPSAYADNTSACARKQCVKGNVARIISSSELGKLNPSLLSVVKRYRSFIVSSKSRIAERPESVIQQLCQGRPMACNFI